MKVLASIVMLLLALASCQASEPVASEEVSPSGLHFSLLQMAGTDDISLRVAWPTDWAYRGDVNQAVPPVGVDLILAGGAKGYPAGQAGERLADLKAEANLFPALDYVYGSLKFKKGNWEEVAKIANAHLVEPSLEKIWLERLRDGLKQRVAEAGTKTADRLYMAARWAALGTQPARNAISLDVPETIAGVNGELVSAWHKEVFTRAPKGIVVAGDINAKDAAAIVDKVFERLPKSNHQVSRNLKVDFSPRRILLHAATSPTTQLLFLQSLPPSREGKELEDLLLLQALGGDDQSELFKSVRTELRASYGFGAGADSYEQSSRFMWMNGEVETPKIAEAEKVVRKAYANFKASGPTQSLDQLKTSWLDFAQKIKLVPHDASYYALQALIDDQPAARVLSLSRELQAIDMVSLKARLAGVFPKPDDFLVLAISPDANALPGACIIERPEDAVNCK